MTVIGPKGLSWIEFDFTRLNWQRFQAFGNELLYLLSHRDPDKYGCLSFLPAVGEGQDRGCDGYHIGKIESQDGQWNVQIKCYSDPSGIHLTDWHSGKGKNKKPNKGEITKTKDLAQITARKPDGLLLIVACEVPPTIMQDWETEIIAAGLKAAIWDRDKLRAIVTQLAPDAVFGADRVFVPVSDWRPTPFLMGQDDFTAPVIGRQPALDALGAFVAEENKGPTWALVTGLEGSGKTHVVSRWSRDYARQALAEEGRGKTTSRWPVAIQGDWKGGLTEHVLKELDPTGRQIIIVDVPLEPNEWRDLAHSLAAETPGQKVKLIVVANGWQARQAKEAFANWGPPAEIPITPLDEPEFYSLADAWGIDSRWRYVARRLTNGLPGLLRLALTFDKPLSELNQHTIITRALNNLATGVGLDPADQRAVVGVLAWVCLTQPLRLQPDEAEKNMPLSFAAFDVSPRAWRKAWHWLVTTRNLMKAHYAHVQSVFVSTTGLLCQAALWQLWSELSPNQRMATLWEAVEMTPEHAVRNAVSLCISGEKKVGKQLLDGFWAGWASGVLKASPGQLLSLLKRTDVFTYYRPHEVLELCIVLADTFAILPGEVSDPALGSGIAVNRDWVVEPLVELAGHAAVASGRGDEGLRLLARLHAMHKAPNTILHNDPVYRQIRAITSVHGSAKDESNLRSTTIVLKEWTQSFDPSLRSAGRYGLSHLLSVEWEDHYLSGSSTVTFQRRRLAQETTWLKEVRQEAFNILLERACDLSLPTSERSAYLTGDLRRAHSLLFQSGPGARPDLIDELCARFLREIDRAQESEDRLVLAVQLALYLAEAVTWETIPNTNTAEEVRQAVVGYFSGDDLVGDYLNLFGTSVSLTPDKALVRSVWVHGEEAERVASPIAQRWHQHFGNDVKQIAARIRQLMMLASACQASSFEPLACFTKELIKLAGAHQEVLSRHLLGTLDPKDSYDATFLRNWLRESWSGGNGPNPTEILNWSTVGNFNDVAELVFQAIGRLRFDESAPPSGTLDAAKRCVEHVSQLCIALNITEVCVTLSRIDEWRTDVIVLLQSSLTRLAQSDLFLAACYQLGLHWEHVRDIVGAGTRGQLIDRLLRLDELNSKCYGLLGLLFANDLSGLLDFIKERWQYGIRLGKEIGRYRPVTYHMMEELTAYTPAEFCRWTDVDVTAAPTRVRDWLLFTYPLAYLEVGHFLKWADALQPDRDPQSGLGVATSNCLSDWICGGDPGGDKLVLEGEQVDTTGVKYWGVAILLRDFDFDESLFNFLTPLIELGEMPLRPRTKGNWRQRIWSELWVACGTTGVYTPGLEREEDLLNLYRTMEGGASLRVRPFFEVLRIDAEHDVEREMLPNAELEI